MTTRREPVVRTGEASNLGRQPDRPAPWPLLARSKLVDRTRDVFHFTGKDFDDPVLVVSREYLELRLPTIEWPHPNFPFASSRIWKRLEWESVKPATLPALLDEARRARLGEYAPCRFCSRILPPEHLTYGACDDCAAMHLGIVH